jgi:hypothetical protein
MNSYAAKFLQLIKHPIKHRMFLLYKLPAAFFSGLKIIDVDETKCIVSVPFRWLTQNPFRSTYFASLAMAAEMSTGVLAMMHTYKRKPAISMLITKMEANYFKKAIGKTIFGCEDGKQISDIIEGIILTGESKNTIAKSIGKNKDGELIAEFFFTWSFKMKQL